MKTELKKVIINWIFDNIKEFQINNRCVECFREYIYTSKGEYLIGGEDVANFISDAIKLIRND